jgi:tetratricopeptide (TPR) repeat protein
VVALWTPTIAVDPANDLGDYNLAVALAALGQAAAAADHYRAVLTLNPAHSEARQNLDRLDAARLERDGDALAAAGRLADAVGRYQAALDHNPHRRTQRRPSASRSPRGAAPARRCCTCAKPSRVAKPISRSSTRWRDC